MAHPHFLVPVALALLAGGCTVHVNTEEQLAREEKRFQVSGVPDVRISTFDGSIEVRSWDRDEVLVEVEKRAADEERLKSIQVRTSQKGNRIDVEVVRPSGTEHFVGIGVRVSTYARLMVAVPRQVTLEARSGDGSIRASALQGRMTLRTSDGSVRASDIKGELDIETGDGSITVDDAEGRVRLTTGDGGITTSGRFASLAVKSGDGSVTVRADRGSEMLADWSIATEDGSVAIYLPDAFSGDLDARTGDGVIRSEFEIQGADKDTRRRRRLLGKIGAGGHLLRVHTGDGSISLRSW